MLEIFRSGWFWDTMCQNTVGKFWQWYCVFSFFQSQNWTDLRSLILLASLWTYCLINVDIEGEKKDCWKNWFVSCPPTGSHVRVDFNHVVMAVLQLCRSTRQPGASLAACFHTCSLACLMHTQFCWKSPGHKGVGIFVASVPESGKWKSFPLVALLDTTAMNKNSNQILNFSRGRNLKNFPAELHVKYLFLVRE